MKKYLVLATWALALTSQAQDSSHLKLSGSVDAYYRYNATRDSSHNNYTSFTNSNRSFALGMAALKAEFTNQRLGATIDMGMGRRAEEFSFNDQGALTIIKQAFVTYQANKHLKLTAGKFYAHVGYESLDAYQNKNYSLSYMFSYGPFFHTGLKAEYTFKDWTIMAGIANPTAYTYANTSNKMILAQVGKTIGKIKASLNYQGGQDMLDQAIQQLDLVSTATLNKVSLTYDGTVQYVNARPWCAHAIYATYEPTKVLGLTLRSEYFDDRHRVSGFIGSNVWATTLSGNIHVDDITIIPEVRLDQAKDPIFQTTGTRPTQSTISYLIAMTWHL